MLILSDISAVLRYKTLALVW